MTITEFKMAIDEMSSQDRLELETYLRARNLASSHEHAEKMDHVYAQVRQGQRLSSADIREMHESMKSKGL